MAQVLYLVTDLTKTQWLRYIVEEFKRINGFQGDIKVRDINDADVAQLKPAIFYAQRHQEGARVTLVNKSRILPCGRIEFVNDKVYVIEKSTTSDERFALPYDLFWNAFVFLSRMEEYLAFQNGKHTLSHCILHPRQDKVSLTIPIVNLLFNELEILIRENFPELSFQETPPPRMELSHDVDYLSKTPQFMLKQTILNTYDIFRFLFCGQNTPKRIRKSVEFLFSRPSYWCFEYWENIEKQFNFRSIFYIHAQAVPKTFWTRIIDPTYDLLNNPRLQAKLRELIAQGFEVGLHGSFLAAVDGDLLRKEKHILENVIQHPVIKGRQHWLRFEEDITPYIHNELLQFDSTLGWNDRVGFRNGCASLFHPYDHKNDRAFQYMEVPQVIMDFNIYQSLGVENVPFVERTFRILDSLGCCKSAHAAISWHQQVCNRDYEWQGTYEKLLQRFIGSGGGPQKNKVMMEEEV